jgi:hypothetical protein
VGTAPEDEPSHCFGQVRPPGDDGDRRRQVDAGPDSLSDGPFGESQEVKGNMVLSGEYRASNGN